MVDFSKLPIELINIIINYTNVIVYRHGKYLNRLSKKDKRYSIIKIKQPIYVGNFEQIFRFVFWNGYEKTYLLFEQIHIPDINKHILIKKKVTKTWDNISIIEDQITYTFDLQGKCNKIVSYTM